MRAGETGAASGRTLRRRAARFEAEGIESLFGSEAARGRKKLPPAMRRLVVDLKAEYPGFNPNEISRVCYVRFGCRPARKTVKRILAEEPIPLRFMRRFAPYHEIPERRDARAAVVALHAEGWSAKAISGYLRVGSSTVYRILRRWTEEGPEGLEARPHGRPSGVRKVTLKAIEAVRRFQQDPNLGEFRIHAALAQIGIHLSLRTCGRILALNRELYGYEKPAGGGGTARAMPFAATERNEVWSADVRHLDMIDEGLIGKAYSVTVIDNYSRAIVASAVTRRQDLSAFLSVLYRAVERHGAPKTLVTDSGSVFLSNQAKAVYGKLGMGKREIEKGRPRQNYLETTFNVQKRLADWHFFNAGDWSELVAAHDRFVADYNVQSHFAHQRRDDGRRSPEEVLSWVSGMRFHPKDLERAFFSERHTRVLDSLGYATLMRWRLYGEEGLAGKEADLWLLENTLTLEHAGEPLSSYEVAHDAGFPGGRGRSGRLLTVRRPTLFETSHVVAAQMRLFGLAETLGEDGWLKALRLEDYAPRAARPDMLQQVLFVYTDAI